MISFDIGATFHDFFFRFFQNRFSGGEIGIISKSAHANDFNRRSNGKFSRRKYFSIANKSVALNLKLEALYTYRFENLSVMDFLIEHTLFLFLSCLHKTYRSLS